MKFLPVASFALVAPLLLTGCSSDSEIDDEVERYEECIEIHSKAIKKGTGAGDAEATEAAEQICEGLKPIKI